MDLGVAFPATRQTVEAASDPSGITYAGVARAGLVNRLLTAPNQSSNHIVEELHELREKSLKKPVGLTSRAGESKRSSRCFYEVELPIPRPVAPSWRYSEGPSLRSAS